MESITGFWCTILWSSLALIWEKEEHHHSIIPSKNSSSSSSSSLITCGSAKTCFSHPTLVLHFPKCIKLTHHHHHHHQGWIKSMLFSPQPREHNMILWSAFALLLRSSCSTPREGFFFNLRALFVSCGHPRRRISTRPPNPTQPNPTQPLWFWPS